MSKNNIKAQFFKQPRYYNSFSCMGGSCPMSCCLIWNVNWTNDEIKKLKNTECSEHLGELINSSFEENGKDYIIKMDDKKRCPFLTEDNFCSIQRELGAEYLSNTCTVYPRQALLSGNTVLNYCNLSCYKVIDTLCNDSECMKLDKYNFSKYKVDRVTIDNQIDIINHPELKYRQQLFELFYDLISDESYSVETSVILGSLAAEKITEFINKKQYDQIPDVINSIKPQLNDFAKTVENLQPNYEYKLRFAVTLYAVLIKSTDIFKDIAVDGGVDLSKYLEGERRFNEAFLDRPFALRNIALNLLLECRMPFRDKNLSLFDNYCYFVAALAVMKIVAPALYMGEKDHELAFKSTLSYLGRFFTHSEASIKDIIALLKEYNCTDHSHIAALLK